MDHTTSNQLEEQTKVSISHEEPSGDLFDQLDNDFDSPCLALQLRHIQQKCQEAQTYAPLRLIDVSSGKIVQLTHAAYVTVSYVWTEWSDQTNLLVERARGIAERMGAPYLWIDQICISQDDNAEKESEVPKMGDYYSKAVATIVMLPCRQERDKSIVRINLDGRIRPSDLPSIEKQVQKSEWAKRVWTFQEAALSKEMVYSFTDGLCSAADLAAATFYTTFYNLSLSPRTLRVRMNGKLGIGFWKPEPVLSTWLYRSESLLHPTSETLCLRNIDHAWILAGHRQCSNIEDHVYAYLGLMRATVDVHYGIGLEAALLKLVPLGLVSTNILFGRASKKEGYCWAPASTRPRRRATNAEMQGYTYVDDLEYNTPLSKGVGTCVRTSGIRASLLGLALCKPGGHDFLVEYTINGADKVYRTEVEFGPFEEPVGNGLLILPGGTGAEGVLPFREMPMFLFGEWQNDSVFHRQYGALAWEPVGDFDTRTVDIGLSLSD